MLGDAGINVLIGREVPMVASAIWHHVRKQKFRESAESHRYGGRDSAICAGYQALERLSLEQQAAELAARINTGSINAPKAHQSL
jgi:hypothetical protein